MDAKNLFHTRATYLLERVDYLALALAGLGLVAIHAAEVRWPLFAVAFVGIDLVGYVPGALWYYTRPPGKRVVPRACHVLYNIAHSFAVNGVGVVAWMLIAGRWEWAMLALPIHLCGDRSLFGNIYKPFGVSFEPASHPAFERFRHEFEQAGKW